MDELRQRGGAGIGGRLRRLSDGIDRYASRVYATLDIDFEQRWFGVLNQLALNGPATVGELASRLRITHVSVSQTRHSLVKAGLIVSHADKSDARRRSLALTPAGRKLVARLQPLWRSMERAATELVAECGGLMACLDLLDDALARRSLFTRIMGRMDNVAEANGEFPPAGAKLMTRGTTT